MTTVNFTELLSVQVESVERAPTFPVGNYDAVIMGHSFGESSKKQTPFVRFDCKLIAPRDDVDEELFEAAGGLAALGNRKTLRLDFYLTKDAIYRLREFMENGLKLVSSGRTFDEVLPETLNVSFIANISHDTGVKPEDIYMNITDYAPVD